MRVLVQSAIQGWFTLASMSTALSVRGLGSLSQKNAPSSRMFFLKAGSVFCS